MSSITAIDWRLGLQALPQDKQLRTGKRHDSDAGAGRRRLQGDALLLKRGMRLMSTGSQPDDDLAQPYPLGPKSVMVLDHTE